MDELTRLLRAAADGDRLALHAFVRQTQADVWRFCAHLVDRDTADDLTQQVYLRAFGAVARFRSESSARTWLLAIARRTCADEIRRRQRRRPWEVLTEPPADREMRDPTGASDLQALVDALGPDRRAAFVLTQQLGLPYREAAEVLGVPVGTVRSRVARAREELVTLLETDDGTAGATG